MYWGGVFTLFACNNGSSDSANNENDNGGGNGNNNENDDGNDVKPVAKGKIIAQMTTVTSELTFYENGTVEFKEENAARSIQARAVTTAAASSSGTYRGNVMQNDATISLSFTSGKRKGKEGTAKVNERDDASNIEMKIGDEDFKHERIQVLVTAWHTSSGKTVYFYNDSRAMQVIKDGDKTTCHPLVYTEDAGKDGEVKLALLDDDNEHNDYKTATISDSTMVYDGDEYAKINDDITLVTAWRATTEEDGKKFIETMYFYSDGTFMIVMNKKVNNQITNGFAGTYTGDTTKGGSVSATIGERSATGTIADNELTISKPEEITYERIN